MALSQNTKLWIHGLAAAFIGAAATTLTTTLSAPGTFNFATPDGLKHVGLSALISGAVAAAGYLIKSPVPSDVTVVAQAKEVTTADGTTTKTSSSVATTSTPTSDK